MTRALLAAVAALALAAMLGALRLRRDARAWAEMDDAAGWLVPMAAEMRSLNLGGFR